MKTCTVRDDDGGDDLNTPYILVTILMLRISNSRQLSGNFVAATAVAAAAAADDDDAGKDDEAGATAAAACRAVCILEARMFTAVWHLWERRC
jgi:hypothetical protein